MADSAPASRFMVIASISFYMVAALVMTTVNKWVLVSTSVPIFFIAMQLFIAAALLWGAKSLGVIRLENVSIGKALDLWKVIVLNTAGLVLGNFTLKFVDASFYQVARGLILPITVLMTFFMVATPPSKGAVIACGIVTLGFFIGTAGSLGGGDKGVTVIGVCYGLTSSIVTAYHSMTIKASLSKVNDSALDLSFYSNFFAALLMIPLAIVCGEGVEIFKLFLGTGDDQKTMFYGTLVTGVVGFMISMAGLLSVKVTSPVSHMVSSAVRGVLQTLISVYFLGDILTGPRVGSIFMIILGSCYYVYVKSKEGSAPPAAYAKVPMQDMEKRQETV